MSNYYNIITLSGHDILYIKYLIKLNINIMKLKLVCIGVLQLTPFIIRTALCSYVYHNDNFTFNAGEGGGYNPLPSLYAPGCSLCKGMREALACNKGADHKSIISYMRAHYA